MNFFKGSAVLLVISLLITTTGIPTVSASQARETSWQAIGQVDGTQVMDTLDPDHLQATPTSAPSGIQICGISFGMVIAAGWIWSRRHRT